MSWTLNSGRSCQKESKLGMSGGSKTLVSVSSLKDFSLPPDYMKLERARFKARGRCSELWPEGGQCLLWHNPKIHWGTSLVKEAVKKKEAFKARLAQAPSKIQCGTRLEGSVGLKEFLGNDRALPILLSSGRGEKMLGSERNTSWAPEQEQHILHEINRIRRLGGGLAHLFGRGHKQSESWMLGYTRVSW